MARLPNPPLNSDPACIAFRSLSISRFLGSVQRLGAGGAGQLHSLGGYIRFPRFNIKSLCIGLTIALVAGFGISKISSQIPFWAGTLIAIFGMLVNGFIAAFEDNQPGGFNNPEEKQK